MEYLILIYEDEDARSDWTDAQNREHLAEYGAYTRAMVDAGVYLGGNALHPAASARTVRSRDGGVLVTDGPFAETKEQLGGYYHVKCDSLAQAEEWASRCPTARHGSIEVRPILELEM